MLWNYIKIAWRNLVGQKLYSLINISGLAAGLAVCMTIMVYVAHETSYDRFHRDAGRIFEPYATLKMSGNVVNMQKFSYVSGPLIKQSQPTVEASMRTLPYFSEDPVIVSQSASGTDKFVETDLLFADAGFFNFFSFKLLSGDASDALKRPFTVVLSKDMANKYFPGQNPVGKTISIRTDSTYTYQVTGVAADAPSNSSIKFNFVTSLVSLQTMKTAPRYAGAPGVGPGSYTLYLKLKHAADTGAFKRSMNAMYYANKGADAMNFALTPLVDTHLNGYNSESALKYLKIFPLIAALILLLALVNYMSLSTARATLRAKEVGVRKVSGASRKTIAAQFYVESALFTLAAFILGYLLCYVTTPWFLNVIQLKIDSSFLYSPLVLLQLSGLLLLTILIAGLYPSVVLSAFNPVITLKGKMGNQSGGVMVRKVFTTLQFAISVGLIICGIVIDRQLYFFRHADTGINKDNVVMIPVSNKVGKAYPALKHDIQSLAGVGNVATSQHALFGGFDMNAYKGKTKGETVLAVVMVANEQFINTVGLKWKYPPVTGTVQASRSKILINEEAVNALHLPPNPIGSTLQSGNQKMEIAGVLKNFNFTSMESGIRPLTMVILSDTDSYMQRFGCNLFAKIKPHTNLPALLGKMQGMYKKYDAETPFNYTFMDDAFNAQYKAEDRLASIFSVFTAITIILATLGLFGLAAFTIEQRTKEIGIRKVLGASVASINGLLSKDFLKLVLLAICVASPLAWWAMHNWLQQFAYRISIQWWVFGLAGAAAVLTAVVTVSYHGLRAAIANPVKSLRSE
jgi:putative ABC transport system permease protein